MIRVEFLEEIFASKLRTVIERKKCRDYFELWQLSKMEFDSQRIGKIFIEKCAIKKIRFKGKTDISRRPVTDAEALLGEGTGKAHKSSSRHEKSVE